jgi:hypothetical protein
MYIYGHFRNRLIGGTYHKAWNVREDPQKIWPEKWYVYVAPLNGISFYSH